MHRQCVYAPQQQCYTKIKQARNVFTQYENKVNETSIDTILGTMFLIIFQARRDLKHPPACIENTIGDSSLDVKTIHTK